LIIAKLSCLYIENFNKNIDQKCGVDTSILPLLRAIIGWFSGYEIW